MTRAAHRVTIAEVAKAAEVSPMTVSYTFSQPDRVAESTRAKVLAAAGRLGYTGPNPAARSLRQGRFGSIGVVLNEPLTYAFEDLQAARFLAGVASVCVEKHLGITLLPIDAHDASMIQTAAVDAFVVWTRTDGDPVIAELVRSAVPAGVLGGPDVEGLRYISIDDRASARAVAEVTFADARRPVVLSMPFDADRRPARLRGPDPASASSQVTRARLAGVRDQWLSAGRDWSEVEVVVLSRNSRSEAEAVVVDLLAGAATPDAILAMSDELALGALAAARGCDVAVPADLAISGWDGSDQAAAAGLTTIEQSLYDQGRALTLAVLDGGYEITEPSWTLVRRSTTR